MDEDLSRSWREDGRGAIPQLLCAKCCRDPTLGARPELHRHRGWLGHPPPLWLLDSLES